jgi:hypothetical protein
VYPFASGPWAAFVHGYLVARRDELVGMLDGADFSLCEVYTHVPREIDPRGRVAIAWAFRGGDLRFALEETTDVDLYVEAEWAVIEPLARTVVGTDPAVRAQVDAATAEAIRAGRFRVARRGPVPAFLAELHDDLARHTAPAAAAQGR